MAKNNLTRIIKPLNVKMILREVIRLTEYGCNIEDSENQGATNNRKAQCRSIRWHIERDGEIRKGLDEDRQSLKMANDIYEQMHRETRENSPQL